VRFNDGNIMDRIPGIAPARKACSASPHVDRSFAAQPARRLQPILIDPSFPLITRQRALAFVTPGLAMPRFAATFRAGSNAAARRVAGLINASV